MQKGLIKKGLVFSVIVLFISVGVKPVFANEVSISTTSDSDENCIECQESDGISLLKAKILLFRAKVVTNVILSSKLGEIPEIKEDCQEISDVINSDKPLHVPLICYVLLPMIVVAVFMGTWGTPVDIIGEMIYAILYPLSIRLGCDP